MHKTPKLAQLGTPRRAQARPSARTPGRIMGKLSRVVAEAPCRIAAQAAVSPRSCKRPCAPCRTRPCAPCRTRPCALCRARRSPRPCASCRACRRPQWKYRERTGCRIVDVCCALTWPCHGLGLNTALPSALLLVTIHHGVLRYSPYCQPFLGTIQAVYCDTTAFPQLLSITIHLVYCNTQPAHTSPDNLQYTLVYYNTVPKPTSLNLYNTMTVLQH